jgi:hypothetical protein
MKYYGRIKTNIITLLLLLLLSFSNNVMALQKSEKALKSKPNEMHYLFAQSAGKVKIQASEKDPSTYKVALKNVDPYITYFTDRPYRSTNIMPIEKFVKLWHKHHGDHFSHIPPNADLIGTKGGFFSDHKLMHFVVELTEPYYDRRAKTLTYIVKPVKGSVMPSTYSLTLHRVFLFIDDVCLSCWEDA